MKIKKLNESKNIGDIYHFTSSLKTVYDILNNEELISSNNKETNFNTKRKEYSFSFTRDINITGYKSFTYGIIFDGNKLSDRYSINPYKFNGEELLKESVKYICKCINTYYLGLYNYSGGSTITTKLLNQVENGDVDGVVIPEEVYSILYNGFVKKYRSYNNRTNRINSIKHDLFLYNKAKDLDNTEIDSKDWFTFNEYRSQPYNKKIKNINKLNKELEKENNRIPIIYKEFENGNEIFVFNSRHKEDTVTGSVSLESLYELGGGNIDSFKRYLNKDAFDDKEERIWFNIDSKNYNFNVEDNKTGKNTNSDYEIHLPINPYSKYVKGLVLPKKEYDEVMSGNIETKYLDKIVKLLPKNKYKYLLKDN